MHATPIFALSTEAFLRCSTKTDVRIGQSRVFRGTIEHDLPSFPSLEPLAFQVNLSNFLVFVLVNILLLLHEFQGRGPSRDTSISGFIIFSSLSVLLAFHAQYGHSLVVDILPNWQNTIVVVRECGSGMEIRHPGLTSLVRF